MIKYIPFLKAKRGEFSAMRDLPHTVKLSICPFFDFPRKREAYDSSSYSRKMDDVVKHLIKDWGSDREFCFDDLDIAQILSVEGDGPYAYILHSLQNLRVIPVVGLGRDLHNNSVHNLKRKGEIVSPVLAFRAVQDDFEEFELNKDQIDEELAPIFAEFKAIDLILDCRFCGAMDTVKTAKEISVFARKFCSSYKVRRVVVTGSSIPASIKSIVKTATAEVIFRQELRIISQARLLSDVELIVGDYATVSPNFFEMDLDPKLFQKVVTPRLVYSFDQSHYISRGISLSLGGGGQYVNLTQTLCQQGFFRGQAYSMGDKYFDAKSKRIGKNATNGTVVGPAIVAHVTYMVLDAKF